MKPRSELILGIIALVAFVGALMAFVDSTSENQLLIQGRSVRYWLENLPNETAIYSPNNPLSTAGPEIIPDLIDVIRHPDRPLLYRMMSKTAREDAINKGEPPPPMGTAQSAAVLRLGEFGSKASNAMPFLIEALADRQSKSLRYRFRIIQTLRLISPQPKEILPTLIHLLSDPEPNMRVASLQQILELGITNITEVPAALYAIGDEKITQEPDGIFHDQNFYLRTQHSIATVIAWGIDRRPSSLKKVISLLQSFDNSVRMAAARSLAFTPPLTDSIRQKLLEMLDEKTKLKLYKSKGLRSAAAFALAKTGSEDWPATLPILIEATTGGEMAAPCIRLLGDIGAPASNAIPTLRAVMQTADSYSASLAREALGKIEGSLRDLTPPAHAK